MWARRSESDSCARQDVECPQKNEASVRIDFAMETDTARIVGLHAIVLSCVEQKGTGRSWHNSASHDRVMVKVLTTDPETRRAIELDNAKFFGWTPPSWTSKEGVCMVVYPDQLCVLGKDADPPVGERFTVDGWQMWFASARLPYWHHAATGKGSWHVPQGWLAASRPQSPTETYALEGGSRRKRRRVLTVRVP